MGEGMPEKSSSTSTGAVTPRGRKPRVKAEIVAAMARMVLSGEIRPGDYLPTEAELCQKYGVSRTVIREASKVLESKGLLSIRSRVGTQVLDRANWNLLDADMVGWADNFSQKPEYIASLMEMRRIIEPAASALAAERATEDDIAVLEAAYRDMEKYQGRNRERYAVADSDFHNAILIASRNHVLIQLGKVIRASLLALFRRTAVEGSNPRQALEMHGDIVAAIKARDPEKARRLNAHIVEESTRDLKV